jgi:hypothetical protein
LITEPWSSLLYGEPGIFSQRCELNKFVLGYTLLVLLYDFINFRRANHTSSAVARLSARGRRGDRIAQPQIHYDVIQPGSVLAGNVPCTVRIAVPNGIGVLRSDI